VDTTALALNVFTKFISVYSPRELHIHQVFAIMKVPQNCLKNWPSIYAEGAQQEAENKHLRHTSCPFPQLRAIWIV